LPLIDQPSMKHHYLLLLFCSILLLSCNKDEIEATVPAYLKIDDISVNITNPNQGSASDNITDAWVFVNDQLIGAFELPTVVPILQTGNVNIKVRGGIFNNGLSNQREIYPFYEFFTLDTNLIPEVVYEPNVVVEYKADAIFDEGWAGEDFESGINLIENPNGDTGIVRITDQNKVFEGLASGAIFLPPGKSFAEVYTPSFGDIPRNGTAVYLELDYKSTHDFAISIYANNRSQQFSVVNFRASSDWNKGYVEFSNVFSTLFNAANYNIAFGLLKSKNDNAELYIDNMKLINY